MTCGVPVFLGLKQQQWEGHRSVQEGRGEGTGWKRKGRREKRERTEEGVHLWGQATQLIWCGDVILSMIAASPWCLTDLVLRALGVPEEV